MKKLYFSILLLPALAFGQITTSGGGGGGGGATISSTTDILKGDGAGNGVALGSGSGVATFLGTPTSANLATALTDETGTGAAVFATSPTLVTPALGTPASGVATNITGLPISTGISGLGTGVATFLGTPTSANLAAALTDETGTGAAVFATSPTLVTPALGTPASGVATNITGLPVSTGISGLGTGVATFLGTPTSANLAAALTDETGTGAAVFATSPSLVTPVSNTLASNAGSTFTLTATAPAQTTSAQNGVGIFLTSSDAVAGSSVAGAGNGANITLTAGNAQRLTSGTGSGGNIAITTGSGIGGGSNGTVNFTIGGTSRLLLDASGNLKFQSDNSNDIGASGATRPRDIYLGRNLIYTGLQATSAAAPTIASATTIAPTTAIVFISGTTQITTITAPSPISSGGGQITLIPTGIFTTATSGNIALASTAVVSKALIMTYDTTTAKWYPSY
jgi:hypothetical protein